MVVVVGGRGAKVSGGLSNRFQGFVLCFFDCRAAVRLSKPQIEVNFEESLVSF